MQTILHNIKFTNYDSKRSILHAGDTKHFIISNEKRNLLENRIAQMNEFEQEELYNAIVAQSSDKRMIHGLQDFQCKFTLLSNGMVSKISQLFTFLFNTSLLYILITLTVSFCIYELFYVSQSFAIGYFYPDGWWLLILVMCLFHEIGHAAACKYYHAPVGNIGVGIAGFRPVMFTDVSGAWFLKKKQRIVVNIGGVYFQSLFVAIMTIIAIKLNSASLFYVCKTMMITVFVQFYPFFRMDGYWMISDILGEPNLYYDAIETVKIKMRNKKQPLNKRQWKLLIYSITFEILVLVFLFVFFIYNYSIIYDLPYKCYLFVIDILNGTANYSRMFNYRVFMTVMILLLFIRLLYQKIFKKRITSLLKGQQ